MTGATARSVFAGLLIFGLQLGLLSFPSTARPDIHVPQADGETLTLSAPAKRIITLAPNLAELVFDAGAGHHLQAVVEFSNFPEDVTLLPRIGDAFRIDVERIIELEPDLVLAWKSGNPQTALQKLRQLGLTVWEMEITRPAGIADAVENISIAAGTQSQGLPVASLLRKKLARLQQQNSNKTAVEYFFQISARPLYTINGEHIISQGLALCGGENIFADLPILAPQVSRESVILANPRAMIATTVQGEPPSLAVWNDWPRLQAVQNENMLYLPADEISQATPRLLDSLELACKLLDEVRNTTQLVEK